MHASTVQHDILSQFALLDHCLLASLDQMPNYNYNISIRVFVFRGHTTLRSAGDGPSNGGYCEVILGPSLDDAQEISRSSSLWKASWAGLTSAEKERKTMLCRSNKQSSIFHNPCLGALR